MEKRKKYTGLIVDFFKSNPEIAIATFCREVGFKGVERVRNAIYKGYTLVESDIFTLIYHLSKFKIQDQDGWEFTQDPDTPIIIAKKYLGDVTILCNELKNGKTIEYEVKELRRLISCYSDL